VTDDSDCRDGGERCREVLEALSDFIDGTLPADEISRIRQHLSACDGCTQFGGRFSAFLEVVRRELASGEPVSPDVAARLRARLRDELRS